MSILVDQHTRVLIQGITGRIGRFHCEQMQRFGTHVVAGVTPGRGGELVCGVPVFDTVKDAVESTGATASVVIVPPPFAADAIMESADSGIHLAVAVTDGIPAHDMIRVKRYMRRYRQEKRMRLLGPNCAGLISPGKALLGIMPGEIYQAGNVGVVSRSATLSYEAAAQMQALGIGISTSVGIGGDAINGSSFLDIMTLFNDDADTDLVVMIGEISGPLEAEVVHFIRDRMSKVVVAYVAGSNASKGRTMGHAGAIISAFGESADEKVEMLRDVGVHIVPAPSDFGDTVANVLSSVA